MNKYLSLALVLAVLATAVSAQTLEVPKVDVPADTASLVSVADGVLSQFRNDHEVKAGEYLRTIASAEYGDYRLWPTIFLANKDVLSNPEAIEIGTKLKIYAPPFDVKQAPNDLQKMAMARAYIETYKVYLPLGDTWKPARRWVLDQALFFDPKLADTYGADLEASDLANLQ